RPGFGASGTAPDRKARNPRRPRQVVPEWPVVDEDGLGRWRESVEAHLGRLASGLAPLNPGGPGLRVEQALVDTEHAALSGPRHCGLEPHLRRAEAVV